MPNLPTFIAKGESPLRSSDTCNEQTFDRWMSGVDQLVTRKYGLSVHDLPDMMFRDSYDAEVSIKDFVSETVADMVYEEFGIEV